MKNKLFGCSAAIAIALGCGMLLSTGASHAAETSVNVTLPNFNVSLNGHRVDNASREYPLLVYKDITYVPMTWYDSRLLGLESKWSPENGLRIGQEPVTSSYEPYRTDRMNTASRYTATVPQTAIAINGYSIDNTKEPYPLLSFRDVTYFPLTWRFAHDEFGWEYAWDAVQGLSIRSHNPQLLDAGLPADAARNDVALYKGYLYFAETEGTQNLIQRAPIGQPSNRETIYTYSVDSGYGLQTAVYFQLREDGLWLTYHAGGVTMGHDTFVRIRDDGTAEERFSGYLDFKPTSLGTLIVQMGNPPHGGNLSLVPPGQSGTAGTAVGNPELLYGRHVSVSESSVGVGNDYSTTVVGNVVYALGSRYSLERSDDLNKIYSINLRTNETTKIVDSEVRQFQIAGDRLIYVKDADNTLYASRLDGTNERKLSDRPVVWFAETDGNIFYTSGGEDGAYLLYRVEENGNDPAVLQAPLRNVQLVDGKLLALPDEQNNGGAFVLDGAGRLLLTITDPVDRAFVSDQTMVWSASASGKIVRLTDLPVLSLQPIDVYINLSAKTDVHTTASERSPVVASLAPQAVHAFEKWGDWYHIRSEWLGDAWIEVHDSNAAAGAVQGPAGYQPPVFVPLSAMDGAWTFEHQYSEVAFNIVYSTGVHVAPNLTFPRTYVETVPLGEPLAFHLSLINRGVETAATVTGHDLEMQVFDRGRLLWRGKVPAAAAIPLNKLATMGTDLKWDHKDANGHPVQAGQYELYLRTPTNIAYAVDGQAGTFTEHIDQMADKTLGGGFTIE
ncbi:MAG: DUF5050 domain-containing protein [Paenibacillaceae bacterium]|nr:DUF5050 domain-containing protein [Paenibacillaceae bacterium]